MELQQLYLNLLHNVMNMEQIYQVQKVLQMKCFMRHQFQEFQKLMLIQTCV